MNKEPFDLRPKERATPTLLLICRWLAMLAVLLWVLAARIEAQDTEGAAEAFEGRLVSSVDLVANPVIDVDRFRPLLAQHSGEPYSQQKVQQSIEALKATRLFDKVDPNVTPEPGGLRLQFALEPALYVGLISFPGAEGKFEYARLMQVVNYPAQEPYDAERLRNAQAALIRFLLTSGYFEAKVDVEAVLDFDRQIANLVFHVKLNERADVGEVKIAGVPPEDAERLEGALHSWRAILKGARLETGVTYNPDRLQRATSFLYSRLAAENRLASQVILAPPLYDRDTKRADVTFQVEMGPRVNIRTGGAHVSGRTLKRLIPIYEENTFDQDLVEEGRQNLISYFQSKGYFNATVEAQVDQTPTEINLLYQIDRGERFKVAEVAFHGNRKFDDEQLATYVSVAKGGLLSRGKFSTRLLNQSVSSLTSLYQSQGYSEVHITPQVDQNERLLHVHFNIEEGPQTVVNSFRIIGNETQPVSALSPPEGLNLDKGKPFSLRRLNQDRDYIVANYLDLGYLNASFDSEVTPRPEDPRRVDVVYKVKEGPRAYISRVFDLGNNYTDESYIDLITQIRPGNFFSQGRQLTAESDLYNTGLFNWVNIEARRPITDQSQEAVLVKVHEAKRNSIAYGFGYELSPRVSNIPTGTVALPGSVIVNLPAAVKSTQQSFSSPRGSVEYARRNMRGRGETLSLTGLVARLDQRASIAYAIPHFMSYNWSSSLTVSGERSSENPVYSARLTEASIQFGRPLNYAKTKTLYLRYSYNITDITELRVPDLIPESDRFVRLSTVSATYVRDTRDKPLDASRGIYQTFDFGLTPQQLGSSASFGRLVGQTAYYRRMEPWLVWANNIRAGLLAPFAGTEVPLSRRFFSGGSDSLRGFPFQGAGPQRTLPVCGDVSDPASCVNITVPVGGRSMFIVNSEARFPIPLLSNLGAVVFYDGGNVFGSISPGALAASFSHTLGFGLRYNTKVGPVRFDIGRNLNPPRGIDATQFFITLGQAF